MAQLHLYNFPLLQPVEAMQWASQWGSVTSFRCDTDKQLAIFGFLRISDRDRALGNLQWAHKNGVILFADSDRCSPAWAAERDEQAGGILFVGQLDYVDEEQLRQLFSPFGAVREIREIQRQLDPHRRRCWKRSVFVEMESHSAALDAISNLNERSLLGTGPVPVRLARKKSSQETDTKLFVGMLTGDTTEQDLISLFAAFGPVIDAVIMRTGTKSRGCGWVKLSSMEACLNAIAGLDGQYFQRECDALRVSFAEKTSDRRARRESACSRG